MFPKLGMGNFILLAGLIFAASIEGNSLDCIGFGCPIASFPENVEDSTVSCNGTNSTFKDPTDCHYFYYCGQDGSGNNTAARMKCPEGYGYYEEWKFCIFEHLVKNCSAVNCPAYMYDGVIPDPANCGSYYRCSYGFPILHNCPQGTIFQAEQGRCVGYESEPACLTKPDNATTTTEFPTTILLTSTIEPSPTEVSSPIGTSTVS